MNSSHISEIKRFADALVAGAAMELYLTPKPGLVDLADCGSHQDLSLSRMERSLHYLAVYMEELLNSLVGGEEFTRQAAIGRRTEKKVLAGLGSNTHKGYIFLSGLFLVAKWRSLSDYGQPLRGSIVSLARAFFAQQQEISTNGRHARERFGAGGIVQEAMHSFPSLFDEALPAYLEAIRRHGCHRIASFAMMGRLMQRVEDTTALHRCGTLGLGRIRRDGRRLEEMIEAGDDYLRFLQAINREYIRMNLTMGGVADMLGLSYAYLIASGALSIEYLSPFERSNPGRPDDFMDQNPAQPGYIASIRNIRKISCNDPDSGL
jgi:triphosphoribosyl-dephospho-CoA synthetase